MDTINKKYQIYSIPILLVFSYIFGFILGEDSSGGAYNDFIYHLSTAKEIENNLSYFLINYSEFGNAHSPLVIIIFHLFNIVEYPIVIRIFSLLSSFLIPLLFFKCLELKFENKNKSILIYLSCFIFVSPYFRSLAYWPGSENLSIIFFLCSIFYYLKYTKNTSKDAELKYIFFIVFFIACASYIRPIYCIFSLFFFYKIILENYNHKKLFYYIIFNLILSAPAVYYVFLLKIHFFNLYINSDTNFITKLGLSYLVFFFYLTPFILIYKNLLFKKSLKILFSSFLIFFLFFIFFKYQTSTGGGFYYHLFLNFFKADELFFIISLVSIISVNLFLNLENKSNLILLITFFLLEADSQFYQETFDPILFIAIFTLFELNFVKNLVNSKNLNKINFILVYMSSFYFISLYKNLFLT